MMQTMGSDIAPVQGGASVQLYNDKALKCMIQYWNENDGLFSCIMQTYLRDLQH